MPEVCRFFFDLGSPYAYLSAERISRLFAEEGLDRPLELVAGCVAKLHRHAWDAELLLLDLAGRAAAVADLLADSHERGPLGAGMEETDISRRE